jgi:phage terminase large subunit
MGKQLQVEASEVFQRNWDAYHKDDKRFIVNQGGSRSGKTYSILQMLIVLALASPTTKIVSIVRKSLPSLRSSAMRDFFEILNSMGVYDESNHSKMENLYQLGKWTFEFMSIDDENKKRGSKRNILYINEANELAYPEYFQLQIRTIEKVIIDYNPSSLFWASDIIDNPDTEYIHSTYKDNPFLPPSQIKEIEKLKDTDEQYYRIYALGEFAGDLKTIFRYDEVEGIDVSAIERGDVRLVGIGMDFGFSQDPTTIVEVWREGNDILYLNELCYKTGMTNQDIGRELFELGIDKYTDIVADSAEPKSVEELRRQGYKITPAKKGPDSIRNGIDILKRNKICITKNSVNLIKEFQNYRWKDDKEGNSTNHPIDKFNHLIDAVRYVALNKLSKGAPSGKYAIRIGGYSAM